MTDLGAMRPAGAAGVLHKATAMGETFATSPDDKHILEFTPPMGAGFWGEVIYRYQDGKFINAEVRRTLKR